ncbi:MAG TPA: hypothetical protein VMR90_03750 [Candidatus Cybelea sp.]|nr:hypothetical protein [Candidatus Cybelea sp.]
MSRKTVAIGVLLVVLFLLAVYVSQNSSTPPGQQPLITLAGENFASFQEAFDKPPEGARLLLLLSPT